MSAVSNASEIASGDPKARRRMSTGQRILFFVTAWLIVLMPFLFWWNTWFGRQLSDKQIGEFLNDEKHPRHIQHALVQLGEHMGQHTSGTGFHEALLKMLEDSSPMVRGNAALSLVRFGDASGRAQIVALLQPAKIVAVGPGRVTDTDKVGTAIHQGGLIAKIQNGQETVELRSPISGRIRTLSVATG